MVDPASTNRSGTDPTEAGGGAPSIAGGDAGSDAAPAYSPPPLPPVRAGGLAHVVVPATGLWFIAFVVLLFFTSQLRANHAMIWLWTCLAGWILGLIGLSIYAWQRAAARRGSRASSSLALGERI